MAKSKIEQLRSLAEQLVQGSADGETFINLLEECDEVSALRDLASEYTPHDEVSVPVYERLAVLIPRDAQIAADLGFVFWLCGQDEKAQERAEKAQSYDPNNVQGLLLRAALASSEDKVELYRQVLEIDPGNKVARAHLRE